MKARDYEDQQMLVENCAVFRCNSCKIIFVSDIFFCQKCNSFRSVRRLRAYSSEVPDIDIALFLARDLSELQSSKLQIEINEVSG